MLKLILLPASAIKITNYTEKLIFLRSTPKIHAFMHYYIKLRIKIIAKKTRDFTKDLLLRLYNLQIFQPADKKVVFSLPVQLDR